MFGNKLNNKLTTMAEQIAFLQSQIGDLTRGYDRLITRTSELSTENEALRARVDILELRMTCLRTGLVTAAKDQPEVAPIDFASTSFDVPIVDHVCVNNNLDRCYSEECIYCHRELNTHNND